MEPVVIALIAGLPAIIGAIAAAWVSISRKLDKNQTTTDDTNRQAKAIDKKLNGGLDSRIMSAVKAETDPIMSAMVDHAEAFKQHCISDDENMKEIRQSLTDLHQSLKNKDEATEKQVMENTERINRHEERNSRYREMLNAALEKLSAEKKSNT